MYGIDSATPYHGRLLGVVLGTRIRLAKGWVNSELAFLGLILVFGEPLKTTDLSAMLLQYTVAGGGKECRPHPFFLYQKV